MARILSGFTLSPECKELLTELTKAMGLSRSAIIELLVREYAERKGVKLSEKNESHQGDN